MTAKPEKVIQVIARFRPPLFADEIGQPFCVKFQNNSVFVLHEKLKRTMQFDFDGALPPETTQEQVYQKVGAKLLQDVFGGYNCTLMTYGQTGSGKSFTMEGKNFKDLPDLKEGEKLDPLSGVVPRLIEDLFDTIKEQQKLQPQNTFDVGASYVEVYRGDLVDCIRREEAKALGWKIHEATDSKTGKVEVRFPNGATNEVPKLCGQTIVAVSSKAQLRKVYQMGCSNRVVEATNANPVSSRGHGIFDVMLTQTMGLSSTRTSLFRIVDLAGSEQAENTGQDAARQREAKTINTSLAMLGGVVLGLSQNDQFINYRRDILTRVLEESLSKGNKSILVVTGKPTANNVKSTLNSLRFASTASFVQGTIFANEKQSRAQLERGLADRDAALKAKEDELAELRALLEKGDQAQDSVKQEELLVIREQEQAALREEVRQLKEQAAEQTAVLLKAREEEMRAKEDAALKAKEEEIASLRAKEDAALRAKEDEIAELREKMAQLMRDFSASAENGIKEEASTTESVAAVSVSEGTTAPYESSQNMASPRRSDVESERLQGELKAALSRMEELEAALAAKEKQHTQAAHNGDTKESSSDVPEILPPGSVEISGGREISSVVVAPSPAFVHPSGQLKDAMKDQLLTQPVAYEAENVLNLVPDPMAEDALPSEEYLAELLPQDARDGKLHNGSRLLVSGLMFVLVERGCFRHTCPDSVFTTCPSCDFTNNRSTSACVNCERKRKFAEENSTNNATTNTNANEKEENTTQRKESLESKREQEASRGSNSNSNNRESGEITEPLSPTTSRGNRSWAIAYFEVSVELQSLLVFHRKAWPQLGDIVRCNTNTGERTGAVRFMGPTSFASGEWIGLEMDTKTGKNDGSVKGVVYFTCGPNQGLFVQRAALIDDQQANSWELTDSVPLVHATIQPLSVSDYQHHHNAFALHTGSGVPWVLRSLSVVALSRWTEMLTENSDAWSEQEHRINRMRTKMTTTFVSGMLRLLRADGSGWQKLFCQVRASEGVFECFDVTELEVALSKNANPIAACVCPILNCEVTRVPHEGTGPKRYVFMLRPRVPKEEKNSSSSSRSSEISSSSLSEPPSSSSTPASSVASSPSSTPTHASSASSPPLSPSSSTSASSASSSPSLFSPSSPSHSSSNASSTTTTTPNTSSLPSSSLSSSAAAAAVVASAFSREAKTRALSFLHTSHAKIKQTVAQRYSIPSVKQEEEPRSSSCLILLADTERELERWVGSLEVFQQFHAPAAPKMRRKDSVMMVDSRLEGFMRSKQNKVLASWHPCYCVLTRTGQLQIYQSKHKWGAGQVFMLSTMTVKETQLAKGQPEKGKGFLLSPKDGKEGFFLGTVDQSDHQAWLEALVLKP